uniref:S-adenosyl-L-methionine-dependent methyltransferase n=1 Tax=Mycena chlorophos TaxID=658473 RepID=A0ABQ0M7C9_MYCCL|nr:S-adenosyl-L-methionine-dependent methyltransferase [Mycena chlorophos]
MIVGPRRFETGFSVVHASGRGSKATSTGHVPRRVLTLDFMHPRNPYRTRPDFAQLAEAYPPLKPCLIEVRTSFTLDFKNEVSQRRLTEALLHRDFGLTVQVPANRLCPPVPNRLNYILWIEDIVNALGLQAEPVYGLDIGTGASAIYPLLGCKTKASWTFLATDIDSFSLQSARNNIERNDLQERIRLFQTTAEAPIFAPLHRDPALSVTFTMCNPPFYSSHDDVNNSAEAKEFEPNAVCTGADVEMITPGGEVAFIRRMLEESARIGTRCRWYTSMLGKMESLSEVVRTLREHSIDNYAITEVDFLMQSIARIPTPHLHSLMPARNTIRQPFTKFPPSASLTGALKAVLGRVDGLQIVVEPDTAYTVSAVGNTWSRSARRKQKHNVETENSNADVALVNTLDENEPYRLRLGEAKLVFLPVQDTLDSPTVVQIIVNTAQRYPTRSQVATFCDSQQEITAAIEAIVFQDVCNPFPERTVELEGNGYTLTGEKVEWVYGRELELKWGLEQVRTAADKWMWKFHTRDLNDSE